MIINSIALNNDWDIAVEDTLSGLKTLQTTCDHRVNYQLVRTGLIANKQGRAVENPFWIDWNLFIVPSAPFQLLGAMIAALINSFAHVESVNLANAEYNIIDSTLEITGVCFISDCETSKLECEVNI